MAAVERVAGSDPDPGDPFRGLYISDEVALRLTHGESPSDADERLQGAVEALGLDLLEAAVLAVCAATELNPRYGRLYAYLQDDVTRKLPSPRLVGQLLEGEGLSSADVMAAFDADGRLRRLGALQADGRCADAAGRAPGEGGRPARGGAARRADGRVRAADPPADGRAARARTRPRRGGGDRHRAAPAREPPPDRARRPGRRLAAGDRVRPSAGRRPRARPRRARGDGRGGADRRARGAAGDRRGPGGHRAG